MAVALISDLHSNQEALTKVLQDIAGQGVDQVCCLGDLVGYGPDPAFVVDRALEWKVVLMGNHDEAVLKDAYGFNPVARQAISWTRRQIRPGTFSSRAKKERWKFLENLPLTAPIDGALLVHGSPRDPTMEYVLRSDCSGSAGGVSEKIRDVFSRFDRVCFAGHTHDPGVITEEGVFLTPKELDYEFRFEPGKKYFVNVGSVGQPRDGDTRSCYGVYEGDRVRWRRVEYDYRVTMKKIFENSQLDRRAGERLAQGR